MDEKARRTKKLLTRILRARSPSDVESALAALDDALDHPDDHDPVFLIQAFTASESLRMLKTTFT